jgi:hypothetical protein
LIGVALLAFGWGRSVPAPQAEAAPPGAQPPPPPTAPAASGDYSQRVVAYINGSEPITREDLGEYLIAREGADRLELLVNKRIIEKACRDNGIDVTEAEIQAAFAEDLKGMQNISPREFVDKVLKQYHKTLYEWKEDVLRPKIAMTKLCQKMGRVHITEEDIRAAFDAYYGEKVECRMIMWPKNEKPRVLNEVYAKIRDSEAEFDRAAKSQANGRLAAQGGKLPPIGHHTTGDDDLEKVIFALHEGDLTEVIDKPEGVIVIKCDHKTPPDKTKKLEDVRAQLSKEVLEKKTQMEIPKLFKELRDQAAPKIFLQRYTSEDDFLREVREELKADGPKGPNAN